MTINCPGCSTTNRLPALGGTAKLRCGRCKYVFTPMDLVKARPEPPEAFNLDREDDNLDGPTYVCKDEDDCGWSGGADELEDGKCPECGSKCRKED